jgi:hypothetical protein
MSGDALFRRVMIALLAIVLILIGTLALFRQMDGDYSIGQAIPLAEGFSIDGAPVEVPRGKCTLIRVTSDNCPYCQKDQPQYKRLIDKAKQMSCSVVTLGPRVGDISKESVGDAMSLQYVDFAVGRALMPFRTPQTLILDASRGLVWQRQGALDDSDLGAALQAFSLLR